MIRGNFRQTVPAEHERIIRAYTAGSRAHVDNMNTPIGDGRKKRDNATPIKQKAKFIYILHVLTKWTASLIALTIYQQT